MSTAEPMLRLEGVSRKQFERARVLSRLRFSPGAGLDQTIILELFLKRALNGLPCNPHATGARLQARDQ